MMQMIVALADSGDPFDLFRFLIDGLSIRYESMFAAPRRAVNDRDSRVLILG